MNVVIADDLSGAAEIAGIGYRYGLRSVLQIGTIIPAELDLIVIDTDTRSKSESEAVRIISKTASDLSTGGYDLIYKKIDSVLRGHVTAEMRMIMTQLGFKKALLAPANPSAGRRTVNGRYYIGDSPLDETAFADDPEFPAKSSEIRTLLRAEKSDDVFIVNTFDQHLPDGIAVVNTEDSRDLNKWAACISPDLIPAGSSEFFAAVLAHSGYRAGARDRLEPDGLSGNCLVVLGSAGEHTSKHIRQLRGAGFVVCQWPGTVSEITNREKHGLWTDALREAFENNPRVIMTTGLPRLSSPVLVASVMAGIVKQLFTRMSVANLWIEGGATAARIIANFGWNRLYPFAEYAAGVVGLRVPEKEDLKILVKPGSYPWPVS